MKTKNKMEIRMMKRRAKEIGEKKKREVALQLLVLVLLLLALMMIIILALALVLVVIMIMRILENFIYQIFLVFFFPILRYSPIKIHQSSTKHHHIPPASLLNAHSSLLGAQSASQLASQFGLTIYLSYGLSSFQGANDDHVDVQFSFLSLFLPLVLFFLFYPCSSNRTTRTPSHLQLTTRTDTAAGATATPTATS